MSIITMKFKLPEEESEYTLASKGAHLFFVLWELQNWLRGELKYHSDNYSKEGIILLEDVRTKLYEFLDDQNIDLNSLVP